MRILGFGKAISSDWKWKDSEEKGWKTAFARKKECKEETETFQIGLSSFLMITYLYMT